MEKPIETGYCQFQSRVFAKIENLVEDMQHPQTGLAGQQVKKTSFRATTAGPHGFTGSDLVNWLADHLHTDGIDEAANIARLVCHYGYVIAVNDVRNVPIAIKDENVLFQFQTPFFWPSINCQPDSIEYAIYLTKRSLKRNKMKYGLDDNEQSTVIRLHKTHGDIWDLIYLNAQEQVRISKEQVKADRILLSNQERTFWQTRCPAPGQANCFETDIRNVWNDQLHRKSAEFLKTKVSCLSRCVQLPRLTVSKAAEKSSTLIRPRVKKWSYGFEELLKDPAGYREFEAFLAKEFSSENLQFWTAVQSLKGSPLSQVEAKCHQIYETYLCSGAPYEINIDSSTMAQTIQQLNKPHRLMFESAQNHIFLLMKKDTYPRFTRSEHYKTLLSTAIAGPSSKKTQTLSSPATSYKPVLGHQHYQQQQQLQQLQPLKQQQQHEQLLQPAVSDNEAALRSLITPWDDVSDAN